MMIEWLICNVSKDSICPITTIPQSTIQENIRHDFNHLWDPWKRWHPCILKKKHPQNLLILSQILEMGYHSTGFLNYLPLVTRIWALIVHILYDKSLTVSSWLTMIVFGFLIWGTSLAILVLSQRNSNHDLRRIWIKISSFEFRWESTKMVSGVRKIKNPKSIMVKTNYKNITNMIGPKTSSGE